MRPLSLSPQGPCSASRVMCKVFFVLLKSKRKATVVIIFHYIYSFPTNYVDNYSTTYEHMKELGFVWVANFHVDLITVINAIVPHVCGM